MNDKEAVDMMQRCETEIVSLRARIDYLKPKAEAYDAILVILDLLPGRRSEGAGVDVLWTLRRRIQELTLPVAEGDASGVDQEQSS